MLRLPARVHFAACACLLTGLCLGQPALAQGGVTASSWESVTSMARIAAVCATPEAVWCATSGGVLRYDPHRRTFERLTRLDGLAGNRVLSVAAGEEGDVWFGTDGAGISLYSAATGHFAAGLAAFAGHRVTGLAPGGDRLYAATESGISVVDVASGRVVETYRQFGALSRGTEVLAVAVHGGDLWAGTSEGAARAPLNSANLQDPESWQVAEHLHSVTAFASAQGRLYCSSSQGVFGWDVDSGRWLSTGLFGRVPVLGVRGSHLVAVDGRGDLRMRGADGAWGQLPLPTSAEVLALSAAGDSLWIGTSQGLAALGAAPPPAISDPPANSFFDMALTPAGNLWVASVPDDRTVPPRGVYQYDGSTWTVHDETSGLPSDFAVAVEVDGEGQVWVGTWGKGVAVHTTDGHWVWINQTNSVLSGITSPRDPGFVVVAGLARDVAGSVWMANAQAGIAVLQGYPVTRQRMHGLALLGVPSGTHLGPVTASDDGLKFAGTAARGLVILDDGGTPWEAGDDWGGSLNTSTEPRLSSDRVTALLASEGVLWIGTDNGLHRVAYEYDRVARLHPLSWREYRMEQGLPSTEITGLCRDAQGNVWVATRGGLAQVRFTGALAQSYTTANSGLVADRVESVLYDGDRGDLWVSTYEGISRLHLRGAARGRGGGILVYPNHFVPGRAAAVAFSGLPLGASLRIFTADGTLVRALPAPAAGADLLWDGTNRAGSRVGTGIYYYASSGGGPVSRGRFAVVARE